jgi:hypothetical protein
MFLARFYDFEELVGIRKGIFVDFPKDFELFCGIFSDFIWNSKLGILYYIAIHSYSEKYIYRHTDISPTTFQLIPWGA